MLILIVNFLDTQICGIVIQVHRKRKNISEKHIAYLSV